jgi:hypothetical protein
MVMVMVVIVVVVAVLVRCAAIRVSTTVAPLIAIEVLDIFMLMTMRVVVLASRRILAVPPIVAIVAVIHVSPELGWPAVPGSCAHKDAA